MKALAKRLKEARKEDLELMAKLTREIGAEAMVAPAVTITIHTNVDPSKLRGDAVQPVPRRASKTTAPHEDARPASGRP